MIKKLRGIRKPRRIRTCKNPNCNKEFVLENWRKDIYCGRMCSYLCKENPMKGKSLHELIIKKHGKEEGEKRILIHRQKMSKAASDFLKNMTPEERKLHRGRNGNNNGMHGISVYEKWKEKYGENTARELLKKKINSLVFFFYRKKKN